MYLKISFCILRIMETESSYITSNLSNIERFIEKNIEKKIGQLMDILPQGNKEVIPKMIHEYTIAELYKGTLQTTIDVINELTELISERKYMDNKVYWEKIYSIFLKNERKLFVGIILVILSFIIYFIDGSEA